MISVIIPTLNEASVLENTLKAFRVAKPNQFQVIVSDGGSTDGTIEIAQKYADKVILKKEGEHQNIAIGRNLGAKEAGGEYLAFFDADVTMTDLNYFYEETQKLFETRPEIVAFTGGLRVLTEYETKSDRLFFSIVNFLHMSVNNFFRLGGASGEFQVIRRRAFEKLGGYRTDLPAAEDQEFFRRLARFGRTYYHKGLTVYHTGRRAHQIGWPKLLLLWIVNGISVPLFGRSFSGEWKEIR